jgi:hypothetical protein
MVAQSKWFPICCSSICPSAVCLLDFFPRAAARLSKLLNPCSMVAQHNCYLTLVSCFCPLACWPPSQPSYALHPHHGLPILRSHDTRGFPTLVPAFVPSLSAALLTFLQLPPTSLLAIINAFRLHVTCCSRHLFQPSSLCISAARPPSSSFIHAARKRSSRPAQAQPAPGLGCFAFIPRHRDYHYPTPHP